MPSLIRMELPIKLNIHTVSILDEMLIDKGMKVCVIWHLLKVQLLGICDESGKYGGETLTKPIGL